MSKKLEEINNKLGLKNKIKRKNKKNKKNISIKNEIILHESKGKINELAVKIIIKWNINNKKTIKCQHIITKIKKRVKYVQNAIN